MVERFSDMGIHNLEYIIQDAVALFDYKIHQIVKVKLPVGCVNCAIKTVNGKPLIQYFQNFHNVHIMEIKQLPGHGVSVVECNTTTNGVFLTFVVDLQLRVVMNKSLLDATDYRLDTEYKCYFSPKNTEL